MEPSGAGHAHSSQPSSSPTPHPSSQIPVEMDQLDASKRSAGGAESRAGAASQGLLNDVSIPSSSPINTSFSNTFMSAADENTRPDPTMSYTPAETSQLSANPSSDPISLSTHEQATSSKAGEPSTTPAVADQFLPESIESTPLPATSEAGPVLNIALLVGSGARHPFKIDEKYLAKRSVAVPSKTTAGKVDVYSISVYTLKELILRDWRDEWEAKPTNPTNIRLIFFGRLLDDKSTLEECRFKPESSNVVHMSVRPQDLVDEEDAGKNKQLARGRDGEEQTAGCRCVVQ